MIRRTIQRARLALAVAWAAVGLIATAPDAQAQTAQAHRGGTLEFAVMGWPSTLDCHAATSYAVFHYVSPHYSLLVKFDQDRYPEVKGDLARSWQVSPDGLVYTFTLRAGVVFHDGTPLTSADVKASFDRLMSPPPGVVSASQALFGAVDKVEAPDPMTIVFRLKRPQSYFLNVLSYPANCIYSAARLAADPLSPQKVVMGTGPFVYDTRVEGADWRGKRFDRYFLPGRPYLDAFRAVTFSQNAAVVAALQTGQVQAEFRGFSPPVRDRLKAAMGDKLDVQESTWALSITLTFNAEKKPFDDPRVRRALNMAIDRWQAAQNLSKIATVKSVGATQRPGSPWAASDAQLSELPGFNRDMEAARTQAKRLLAEAGQSNLKFRLSNRAVPDPYTAIGVYLIDQWRRIGVTVDQQSIELKSYDAARSAGEYEAIVEYTNALVDDPELELVKYISHDRSPLSFGRYTDRELDGLYDRVAHSQDHNERLALTRAFEKRLADQAYMMPILWMQRISLMSSRVKGWRITPTHLVNQDLVDVWLAP